MAGNQKFWGENANSVFYADVPGNINVNGKINCTTKGKVKVKVKVKSKGKSPLPPFFKGGYSIQELAYSLL